MTLKARWLGILCAVAVLATGCKHRSIVPSGENYRFGTGWHAGELAADDVLGAPADPIIEEGQRRPIIDAAGWVVGIPAKILLWDRRAKNHQVTDRTRDAVADYVERNGMNDICIRVNQYAPWDEWRRLHENVEVGPGWRYTVGACSVLGYTLFPGRIFGHDKYNPYTNSLYVYSDIPALGIQAAAYAKDLRTRSHPGTYAFVNELPVASMWHQTLATQDAIDYVAATGDRQAREESLVILYPHYGLMAGGTVEGVLLGSPLIPLGGLVLGHLSGRATALVLPNDEPASAENAAAAPGILQTGQNSTGEVEKEQPAVQIPARKK